jgi:glucokinase
MNSERIQNTDRVLLADIGGTNARFALLEQGVIGAVEHIKAADFPLANDAVDDFLVRQRAHGSVQAAVLAVAGPVENNRCVMTNSNWIIDGAELVRAFGFEAAYVLNDFEVLAWSLPSLQPADLFQLGVQQAAADAPMLAVGPGTGFGASCLIKQAGAQFAVVTEAGHATLPATGEREERIIAHLRRRFGHLSIERALSGPGLQNLYEATAFIEGTTVPERDPAAVTQAALEGSCPVSRAALELFCSLLGTVAGNLALTFCARGGVYIAGGIVPRFPEFLAASGFRAQFESKGRYEGYLRKIPTTIIVRPDSTFIGLKAFFDRNVAGSLSHPPC